MEKAQVNPHTGIVDAPIHPCIKAEGLCRLRVTGGEFHCVREPPGCRYLASEKKDG